MSETLQWIKDSATSLLYGDPNTEAKEEEKTGEQLPRTDNVKPDGTEKGEQSPTKPINQQDGAPHLPSVHRPNLGTASGTGGAPRGGGIGVMDAAHEFVNQAGERISYKIDRAKDTTKE